MSKDIERAKDLLKHTAQFAYQEGLEYYGNMMLKAVDLIEKSESEEKFFYDFSAHDYGGVKTKGIDNVLKGKLCDLVDAFVWEYTQQGHHHWSNIYHERSELTDHDIKYLKWLKEAVQK